MGIAVRERNPNWIEEKYGKEKAQVAEEGKLLDKAKTIAARQYAKLPQYSIGPLILDHKIYDVAEIYLSRYNTQELQEILSSPLEEIDTDKYPPNPWHGEEIPRILQSISTKAEGWEGLDWEEAQRYKKLREAAENYLSEEELEKDYFFNIFAAIDMIFGRKFLEKDLKSILKHTKEKKNWRHLGGEEEAFECEIERSIRNRVGRDTMSTYFAEIIPYNLEKAIVLTRTSLSESGFFFLRKKYSPKLKRFDYDLDEIKLFVHNN